MPTAENRAQYFKTFFPEFPLPELLVALTEKMQAGHVCIPVSSHDEQLLIQSDLVGNEFDLIKPFILHNGLLYFQRNFKYESNIYHHLSLIIENEKINKAIRLQWLEHNQQLVGELFHEPAEEILEGIDYRPWQLVAAVSSFMNNFTIISGGPGTGKTTTVAKIIRLLLEENKNLKVKLAAPTGKAAARLQESLLAQTSLTTNDQFLSLIQNTQPTTIHRLLGVRKNAINFYHNQHNPINADVVIIDECSMIDLALMSKLFSAIAIGTRIIFLGDKNQLASVEAGSVFGDICQSVLTNEIPLTLYQFLDKIILEENTKIETNFSFENQNHLLQGHVFELLRSRRFKDNEGIGKLSKIVLNNHAAMLDDFILKPDRQVDIDFDYQENKFNDSLILFKDYILEQQPALALKKFNQVRFLVAIRMGKYGLYETNKKIISALEKMGLIAVNGKIFEHLPLMLTRNFPDLDLFNGDTGIVRYNQEYERLMVYFEDSNGQPKWVAPGLVNDALPAFCITIHKSQGSEFNVAHIILPNEEHQSLTKEILYTAITRAKNKVVIQSSLNSFLACMNHQIERVSGLPKRFNKL